MRQTDYVILGLLCEAPLTGYQIKRIIDIRFKFFWNESYGQLYPTLKRLNAVGFIEEDETVAGQGRAQKTYRITSYGIAALKEWLRAPVEKESVRLEILLKMYFSRLAPPDVMLEHLAKFQEAHARDLGVLNAFEKELKGILEQDANHADILRVIDFGQRVNTAYLDWCRETMAFLESRELQ